jgi:hypothetical protein
VLFRLIFSKRMKQGGMTVARKAREKSFANSSGASNESIKRTAAAGEGPTAAVVSAIEATAQLP